MKLTELPAMLVERVEHTAAGTTVHGRFDRLEGVRDSGCLRLRRGKYAWAELSVGDRASCSVRATVTYVDDSTVAVCTRYVRLDRYWQCPFVEALADDKTEWRRFTFQATDAQYFMEGNAIGWHQVGSRLPDGAVPLGVKSGGWDHEHCDLCGDQINAQGPIGYTDPEGHFLRSRCYDSHGASHDVSYQLSA